IFHNLAYSDASPFTISGNTFTVLDAPTGTKWDAIMLSSLQGSVNATVTGNIITGTDVTQLTAGYQIWNTPTTALLTITGGSVSGTDYGVWVNNFDGYNSDADNTAIILSGVQISDTTLAGVYILDNPSEVHGHTVKATLLDGVVINDCTTGIWVSGPQASVNSYGNLIQNNATGALFESDAAGTLANNSLTGNTTAITNTGATLVNASSNWFGTADATAVAGLVSDLVDYTPWLNSGTDTGAAAGFQGDFSYLNVDDDSPQAGSVGRIQEGVNLVSGSTVNVLPGVYAENVLVDKYVVITGAGSSDTADDTIVTSPATVDYKVGVFQIAASGLSSAEPIVLQNMRVQPNGQAGVSIGRFTEATGVTVDYLTLDNLWVIGTNNNAQTEQERGLYVDLTSTLNYLTVTDCAFNNLAYGWYIQKQVSADASTVSNVVVTNTVFNHNNLKGIYTEKLTDATFTDCTIDQNGFDATGLPSYFIPWMSGVDINLKAGTYQNIAFINATVTNNGLGGAKEGVGLAIKARTDGATYSPYPATLDNVLIANSTITGNERGIRIGEPGKNNPGPTNVVIHHNRIFGNVQTYSGTDGTTYGGVVNQSAADVTAENNWFGCNEGPNMAGCDAT
ncbi:MAG TPA: right-handed parallel beta-helix repeat-containing protein, partial [Anaerolineaceae bacterium]|nr:right-handed parallel beta-helix repeat-containing protein [Anaerolineaceae bacterium]